MRTENLLVSSVNITEDEYIYKGLCTLSLEDRTKVIDIGDLENPSSLQQIKDFFILEEPEDVIRQILVKKVMEKAVITSRDRQGENYSESAENLAMEKPANSLDIA